MSNRLGMPDRGEEGDAATERVADHVRLAQPEVPDQGRDVVAHQAHVDRPVDIGGPPVALEVGDDHQVAGRERRQQRPEHLTRSEPAMEQDDRPAGAVRLVIEVNPVDVGILPGALGLDRLIDGRHGGDPPVRLAT